MARSLTADRRHTELVAAAIIAKVADEFDAELAPAIAALGHDDNATAQIVGVVVHGLRTLAATYRQEQA